MLELVDYYAGSFVVFILATLEITGIFWVYGLENFLDDVEYMLKNRPSAYWRICWAIVVPLLLAVILIYTIVTLRPLTYSNISYPDSAHGLYYPYYYYSCYCYHYPCIIILLLYIILVSYLLFFFLIYEKKISFSMHLNNKCIVSFDGNVNNLSNITNLRFSSFLIA